MNHRFGDKVILILLQILAIIFVMILLGWEAYYVLGFVSAIFILVTEFSIWKNGIEEKFQDYNLVSMDVETSISIYLLAKVFFNCVIVFLAWPAIMLSKFFAGFVPPPSSKGE